jgi:hypothetical protein
MNKLIANVNLNFDKMTDEERLAANQQTERLMNWGESTEFMDGWNLLYAYYNDYLPTKRIDLETTLSKEYVYVFKGFSDYKVTGFESLDQLDRVYTFYRRQLVFTNSTGVGAVDLLRNQLATNINRTENFK